MGLNQVQLRLSIDGKQALSQMSAIELKVKELSDANKKMANDKAEQDNKLKENLKEIYKLQEKQAMIEKNMAAASASGNVVQLSRLDEAYESNRVKLDELFSSQVKIAESANVHNEALKENNKVIKESKVRLEELYLTEGDVLKSEATLVKEKRALNREISLAGNGSERQAKAEERLAVVEKELTNRILDRAKATISASTKIIKEQGFEKISTEDLIKLNKALEAANKHRSDTTSQEAKEEIESIRAVNEELGKRKEALQPQQENDSGGIFGMLKNVKSGLMPAIVGGAIGSLAGGVVAGVGEIFSKIADGFSSTIDRIKTKALELTAIQTSLDVSRIKAKELNDNLSSINTITPVSELNKLIEVGGDLNVTTNEMQGFVRVADQIGVVMKRDLGDTEEAVTMIAKLKKEFKETRDLKYEESLQKIASLLKELNLAGPASSEGIIDFLKRVGNIPDAIKPSITELSAFAAVFEESNLSAEVSATAFSNIIITGANNINLFAKQMKVSREYLRMLINEDPNKFILKFGQSLQGLEGDKLANTLKRLHLDGSEALKTIGVLTDNIEVIREKQYLANDAFEKGTTIQRIFGQVMSDEAAKIEQTSKAWEKIKTSMTSWAALLIGPLIQGLANITKKGEDISVMYQTQANRTKNLVAATTPLVEKYNQLSKDAKAGAKNSKELQEVVGQIGKVVPEAVTQWDAYGRAISVNIGLVDIAIKKNKELVETMKLQYTNQYSNANNALAGKRAEIVRKKNEFARLEQELNSNTLDGYTKGRLQIQRDNLKKQMSDFDQQLLEINQTIEDNHKAKKKLNEEVLINPVVETEEEKSKKWKKGKKTYTPEEQAEFKKQEEERKVYLQEQTKKMIELKAKLAFEERIAAAKEEDKKIIQLEKKAQDELETVRTQFKTKKGLVIQEADWTIEQKKLVYREEKLIEKRLAEEKLQIQKDYNKKRDDLYEQQALRSVQIAIDSRKEELQNEANKAKQKGNVSGAYTAERSLIAIDESGEVAALKLKYIKEQEEAKDNAEALKLIDENYLLAQEAITKKYKIRRANLLAEYWDKEKETAKKNRLSVLELDTQDPAKNAFKAKIALLEAQRLAEIENAEKTGESVENINRKFNLQREALERANIQNIAEAAVGYYQMAFTAVSSIAQASVQNRMTNEQNAYDSSISKLNDQKEFGLLTDRQYKKQKEKTDKDFAVKERKLKKEQFELDKAANVSGIIINTGLAIMKAAPNIPLQIATGVLGGVQLGIALDQASPYADGGHVEMENQGIPLSKKPSRTAVLAWLNEKGPEFVLTNEALNHPMFPDLEPILMQMNKGQKISAYAEGGFTGNFQTAKSVGNNAMSYAGFTEMVNQFGTYINQFGEIVKMPISANVAIGHEEIYKMEQEKLKLNNSMNDAFVQQKKSLI